ncbi:response regulator transcription factor [Clostridium estertheticum]|uniref:Stage 0 sporulation protein A homolog n=1 Tax=Clostridium estertheticum subsp. estertheticum TaxID=1552 RepID=A0A1J0GKV5_9CLOT|nr:response regulator [Clostridium estertheticum]APC41592.1 DNA-binding response regulator [Clostridium estertheticum subsp. estertheticum]MBU3072741.1 response regulator [Clostridium estertheticum]MBU3163222.1 response regulator [Clostridium estertheticum]MBU3172573.1 response regulator [Clostridium estertheticum]MBZ9616544.1 response regulator [Clostridium estertheticum subsp. laramiense]
MYKLLIADDEPRIRKGLRNALNWNEFNIEVVGEAEDGEIALNQTEKLKPDIIFLDICMPFLNGLELIRKLNEKDQNCIIIIITGYDEFEYMHEALKLKTFDYLLKPVPKEVLIDTVNKAIQEIRKNEEKKVYLDWADRRLDENFDMLKQAFLNNWLNGSYEYAEILNELKFFKYNFDADIEVVVIKVIERLNHEVYSKNWDRELLNFALINVTLELMSKVKPEITYTDEDNNIVIISNVMNAYDWLNIANEIENKIYYYLHFTVIIEHKRSLSGISGVKNTYNEIIASIDKIAAYKPIVLLATRYIDTNYNVNDLNLGDVADKFNLSSSYLSKLLKKEAGLSFIDYLTKYRINKSICMMDDPKYKIYEIAQAVGYSNQHYFCKAFKKVMGFAPTEYRGRSM